MTSQAAPAVRALSGRHASALLAAAGLMLSALLLLSPRSGLWIAALAGTFSSLTLAHFAARQKRGARALLSPGRPSRGRVRESTSPDSLAVFEFSAAGTEPWAADAFTLVVVTLGLGWAGIAFGAETRILTGLLFVLVAAMGVRTGTAPADRVRLELASRGWVVEAFVFGRPIRRSGTGLVLPELLSEALVLWSEDGRIGVLRGELEPEERAWLAERLIEHTREASAAAKVHGEVDEHQADQDRQETESEHNA
jgi:hypothetical protein